MAQNRGKSRHSGALPAPAVASGNPFEDIPITSPEAPERLAAALAERYRIERELGQGGMATVYLAHDLRHDRKVALKVLKPELAAVLGAERFVAEIRTTAALQHPHILPLFDSGTADGFLYYVMPFIDGETLRSRLDRERQLGIDEAVRLTSDIADALDYAHRHGVIHRDIKPENILLHDGRPVVADFGIALAVSAAAGGRMTETGLSLGTPHYMSPEQATADREITARSDIYSLGSVLYEMLTGDPPHTGASAQQIIMKIVTEEAQPVTQLRKAVPPNVAAALAKSLEKLPADRFESAHAFAAALNDPHFTTARAAGLAVLSTRAPSRRAFAALAIVAFLASALAIWGWSRPTARPGRGEVVRQQLTFSGMALAPAISPDGRIVAYVQGSCEHAMVGLCRYSLVVQEVGGSQTSVLIADALRLGTPRWTHDGETVVVRGSLDAERTGLFAVNRLSGTARLIGPSGPFDTHPSADSVLVIPPRPSDVGMALVIGLASGTVADSFPLGGSDGSGIRDVAWSPDARHIGTVERNRITVVDREGRRAGLLDGTFRQSLRWTPDGRGLLVFRVGSVREDEFLRIDVDESGRLAAAGELILSRVPTLYFGLFDVARTTGRMALGTGDAISDIWSFDLGARPIRGRRLTRGTTWYGEPALGADGRAVYYLRGDALGDNAYRYDLTTDREEALTAQRFPGGSAVRISPDGRRLAYAHSIDSTRQLEFLELPSRRVSAFPAPILAAWTEPLGTRSFLSYLSSDGSLAVLDSVGASWRAVLSPDTINAVSAAGSPEGGRVAFVGLPGPAADLALPDGTTPSDGGQVAGILDLDSGAIRLLAQLEPGEPDASVSWGTADAIYLARWRDADPIPGLWKISESGVMQRVGDLPAPCLPTSTVVGARGTGAACLVEDFRADIWLYDLPGVER